MTRKIKRIISVVLAVTMVMSVSDVTVFADTEEELTIREKKSNNITWFVEEGNLIVNGTGDWEKTDGQNGKKYAPWYDYRKHIKSAEIHLSGITDASYMFFDCTNLESINFDGFDTSKVTDMNSMFTYCEKLKELKLDKFDTGRVTDMSNMFCYCYALDELDLTGFDTSNVTNMEGMFAGLNANLNLSTFDTGKVTSFNSMFGLGQMESLDLSNFDSGNVTNMTCMFYGCDKLKSVDLTSFDTSRVTDMSYMFYNCKKLEKLNLSSFDAGEVSNVEKMFSGCLSLNIIHSPKNLSVSCALPASFYLKKNGIEEMVTKLPQNMSESVMLSRDAGNLEDSDDKDKSKAKASVKIVSVTPDYCESYEKEEITFTAEIEYTLSGCDEGIIYLGFNTEKAHFYELYDHEIVGSGKGRVTLSASVIPIHWGEGWRMAQQGVDAAQYGYDFVMNFMMYTSISVYPHESSWTPLATDEKALPRGKSDNPTPTTPNPNDSNEEKIVEVPFENKTLAITWNPDEMFDGTADTVEPDNHLAIAGLVLSAIVAKNEDTMRDTFSKMNFKNIKPRNYNNWLNIENPACTYAGQKISTSDGEKVLIAVAIRGTNTFGDAMSDIIATQDGYNIARIVVDNTLDNYINDNYDSYKKEDFIFFIVGHSMGAATASLVGKDLSTKYSKKQVYTYTYASPKCLTLPDFTKYNNIKNYINVNDAVPYFPHSYNMNIGIFNHFSRIGRDIFFDGGDERYLKCFKVLTGENRLPKRNNVWIYASTMWSNIAIIKYIGDIVNPYGNHSYSMYMAFLMSKSKEVLESYSSRYNYYLIRVKCPVDVKIYEDGECLSKVTDNEMDEEIAKDNVFCYVKDDEKYFVVSTDSDIQVELIGNDTGEMSYSVSQLYLNDDEQNLSEKTFNHVQLEDGKKFRYDLNKDESVSETTLYVVDEYDEKISEVNTDGTETKPQDDDQNQDNEDYEDDEKDYDFSSPTPSPDTDEYDRRPVPDNSQGYGSGNNQGSNDSGNSVGNTVTGNAATKNNNRVKCDKLSLTYKGKKVNGTLNVRAKKAYKFQALPSPSHIDVGKLYIKWSTSNQKVATVKNGTVTVKKKGKTVITARTADGKTAKITLKAQKKPVRVTKIKLSGKKKMKAGKKQTLKLTVAPITADNQKVTWKSSNPKVASVNKNGKVKAKKRGKVTITAKAKDGGGKKETIKIRVTHSVSQKQSARVAYRKFLKKKNVSIKVDGGYTIRCDLSQASFVVQDLNHDNIPELILDTVMELGLATTAVTLTYHKGKVKWIFSSSHGLPSYYPKGSVFRDSYYHNGYSIGKVYKIIGGKAALMAKTVDDTDAVSNPKGRIFYIGGKKVSKKKYTDYMNKMTKSTLKKEKSLARLKWHKISRKNIEKYV